MFNTDKTKTTV